LPKTLIVHTASPADRAAPRKPASQEIANSDFLPSRSRAWRRCAPTHIFLRHAQFCTSQNPRWRPNLRIAPTNYSYLEKIGFESQNLAQPAPSRTAPRTCTLTTNRESHLFVFIRVHSWPNVHSWTLCTVVHKPNRRLSPVSNLSETGFPPQKTPNAPIEWPN
jgi:hypothetical protein